MSPIDPNVELLLNASIDDALSPEEQEQLAQLLQHDEQAQRELQQLRALASAVRNASRPLVEQAMAKPLGRDFAQRVVDRAVAAAQHERLPADHPLLLGSEPEILSFEAARTGRRRWSAVLVAASLAAATLAGVILGTRPNQLPAPFADNTPVAAPPAPVAQHAPAATPDSVRTADPVPEMAIATNNPVAPSGPAIPDNVVAADVSRPSAGEIASDNSPSPMRPEAASVASAPALVSPAPSPTAWMASVDPPPAAETLVALLVVSVNLSDRLNGQAALEEAFSAAGITLDGTHPVTPQVLSGLAAENVVSVDRRAELARMYYVQSPAQRIDRLLSDLISDRASFGTVGFCIATDPAVLAAAGQWRPGAEEWLASEAPVAVARGLVAVPGQTLRLDGGSAILPLGTDPSMARSLLLPAADSGNPGDFISQFLLIVH